MTRLSTTPLATDDNIGTATAATRTAVPAYGRLCQRPPGESDSVGVGALAVATRAATGDAAGVGAAARLAAALVLAAGLVVGATFAMVFGAVALVVALAAVVALALAAALVVTGLAVAFGVLVAVGRRAVVLFEAARRVLAAADLVGPA